MTEVTKRNRRGAVLTAHLKSVQIRHEDAQIVLTTRILCSRSVSPYSVYITPALCGSLERRRFFRPGVPAESQSRGDNQTRNGSQQGVTDMCPQPPDGFLKKLPLVKTRSTSKA